MLTKVLNLELSSAPFSGAPVEGEGVPALGFEVAEASFKLASDMEAAPDDKGEVEVVPEDVEAIVGRYESESKCIR